MNAMNLTWQKASDALDKEAEQNEERYLITGFINEDPEKGRWYSVATYSDGAWWDYESCEEMYPPTHVSGPITEPDAPVKVEEEDAGGDVDDFHNSP